MIRPFWKVTTDPAPFRWRAEEQGEAKVYLLAEEDAKNMAMLTDQRLVVLREGNYYAYEREYLLRVDLRHKKLLFPLTAGGILAGLVGIAIFTGLAASWLAILVLMGGIFLFYTGISGSWVLTITERGNTHNIMIPYVTDNVKAFAGYVNDRLTGRIPSPFAEEKKKD